MTVDSPCIVSFCAMLACSNCIAAALLNHITGIVPKLLIYNNCGSIWPYSLKYYIDTNHTTCVTTATHHTHWQSPIGTSLTAKWTRPYYWATGACHHGPVMAGLSCNAQVDAPGLHHHLSCLASWQILVILSELKKTFIHVLNISLAKRAGTQLNSALFEIFCYDHANSHRNCSLSWRGQINYS